MAKSNVAHKEFCNGSCDEGRECWRMNLISPDEAAHRGIKLLDEDDIEKIVGEANGEV